MGDAEDAHAGRAAPPPLEYQPPPWSGEPKHGYSLDVIKSGTLVESIELGEKPFYVIGALGHPTCSSVRAS